MPGQPGSVGDLKAERELMDTVEKLLAHEQEVAETTIRLLEEKHREEIAEWSQSLNEANARNLALERRASDDQAGLPTDFAREALRRMHRLCDERVAAERRIADLRAIVERWSMNALRYVKERAWKIAGGRW